jgi:hypothetical protein
MFECLSQFRQKKRIKHNFIYIYLCNIYLKNELVLYFCPFHNSVQDFSFLINGIDICFVFLKPKKLRERERAKINLNMYRTKKIEKERYFRN